MVGVRRRERNIMESLRGGSERRLEDAENLDLIRSEARFTGPKVLEVRLDDGGTVGLTAENMLINVGARPGKVPVEGIDTVPALSSTTNMEMDEVPDHLLVLGGYVGLEFAQMFRRFGSEVTVVQRGPQLLARSGGLA